MKVYETVIHRTAVQKDKFGDPIPGTGGEVPVDGVRVAPVGHGDENTDRADTVITGFLLLLPVGTPIPSPADQYKVRGLWRSVDGEPFDAGRKGILVNVTGGQG